MVTPQELKERKEQGRGYGDDFDYKSYLDDDLYQLYLNNPYTHMYYSSSLWDDIGLSNKAKDANAGYQQLYKEYISNLMAQQAERNYNSPSNQSSLERKAGLNPDLTGISGTGVSDFPEIQNAPPTALNGISPSVDILTRMGSILSFALNAYNGIKSTHNMLDAQNITNIEKLTEAARPYVTQSFAEAFMNGMDLHTAVASGVDSFSKLYNNRNRKQAYKAFENLFYSSDYTIQRDALRNMAELSDEQIKKGSRDLFLNNEKAVQDFIKFNVDESILQWKLERKRNISRYSKEKILDDFRYDSIVRLRDNYQKSGGHDIFSGLLLAGMLESQSVHMLSDPKSYLMLSGDKISKDVSSRIYNLVGDLKNLF